MASDKPLPTKDELLAMSPLECYHEAVRQGIESAVGKSATPGREDALAQWYRDHPVFADRVVSVYMQEGARQDVARILDIVSKIPNCTVASAT